jgi:hypothetical protein
MSLFKRRIKENSPSESMSLPDLPQLPYIPKDEDMKLHSSQPLTREIEEKSNQNMIKSAIRENFQKPSRFEPDSELIRPQIEAPRTREFESEDYQSPYRPVIKKPIQIPSYQKQPEKKIQEFNQKPKEFKQQGKQEPVFVRVDKYKSAVNNLQDVKQKLMEIEKLLGDIKELKNKEELELNEWGKEIQSAKSKLDTVDKMLFSQLGE